ncbi:MAG: hypothetical protein K9H49_18145 [Bacteroidales bacterium]|nr:hypothetical protein [Bacteroidales bacterium]MCF8391440.1 hypothetical protein [Bacteroidales bacterium]
MKSVNLTHLVILVLIILSASACNKSKQAANEPYPQLSEYVSGYTAGPIARSSDVIIKFIKPVIDTEKVGSGLESGTLTFNPSIEGSAIWDDVSTLIFTPENKFDWATEYKVKLKLKKIFGGKGKMNDLDFIVFTPEKNFNVDIYGLTLSDENDKIYTINAQINTTDEFETDEIEKIFSASQNNTELELLWEHSPESRKHSLIIKNVMRFDEESEVLIKWNGKAVKADNVDSKLIKVPSLKDFKLTSTRIISYPSIYLAVEFSDRIKSDQEVTGMVTIDGVSVSRIIKENNILQVFPNTRLTGKHNVIVDGSLSNTFGHQLGDPVNLVVDFGGLKPGLRLSDDGVIVPQSEGLIFPFEAVNLNAVDVRISKIFTNNIHSFLQNNDLNEDWRLNYVGRVVKRVKIDLKSDREIDYGTWNYFTIDLSDLIEVEKGAIYRLEIGFRKSYAIYPCAPDPNADKYYSPVEEEGNSTFNSYESVFYNHYYNWETSDNPCSQSYYSPGKFVNRNILGSNFGIIAKKDVNKRMNLIITNLTTAKPVQDVEIKAYDFQNQLITTVKSDRDGFAAFQSDRDPFLIVATKNDDIGYLKTEDGNSLSMSNFDVSGKQTELGLKGFLYGERGVWRPGDSVFVAFILEDRENWLPEGHPIVFELTDSRGQIIKRITRSKSDRIIYPFYFITEDDAPTGNWNATVRIGGTEFNKQIRIETVKPNRLKINLEFSEELLIAGENNSALLSSKWLHGTPASGMKAKIGANFMPIRTSFKDYPEFIFDAPLESAYLPEMDVFESNLDTNGEANVNFFFKPNSNVNGMLNATFITRVFESGGDFSINRITKKVSPFRKYVGFTIPWSNEKYKRLDTDKEHTFDIVTVSESGLPVSASNIEVKVFKLEWRYWWSRSGENLASYAGKTYHRPVFTKKIATASDGTGSFSLKVPKNSWGRYLVYVTLPSGNTAGEVVYFDWPWGRQNGTGGADILAVSTDKDTYSVGEQVTINFPAGLTSTALVSIENGSKLIKQEWVQDIKENTIYRFTATAEMSPNAYIHISLLNPHSETANDLPIRMYGISPILVEDPKSHLYPVLSMPDKLKPEKQFDISISESNGRAMYYTLAIVDEGILDLTSFKTPDPWPSFYQKEALGVKTWDMYRYVLGAYGGELERMFAIGGDEEAVDNSKNKAKRFEPVVKVLGPYRLEKGKTNTHKIILPQYVGSVRAMVIAADGFAYGNVEKTVQVSNPVMVLATMPRVLGPGEKIKIPVSVFVMEEGIKKVNVEIKSSDLLIPVNGSSKIIEISQPGEYDVEFEYKIAEKTGQAKVAVSAVAGNESGKHEININIRNPNPPETKSLFKVLEPGMNYEELISSFGTTGSNTAVVEISGVLPVNLEKRLGYLISYPHGCVEQTTSSVFPQLFLSKITKIEAEKQDEISSNIVNGIEKLRSFQLPNGGLSFWPGGNTESEWGTLYATHFLLEAEKLGYSVSATMKSGLLKYLKREANNYSYRSHIMYLHISQAYRLYVLSLSGDPALGAMNRLRERKDELDMTAKWYLAGAYALAGRKEVATELIDLRDLTPRNSFPQNYGSIDRNKAVVLTVLTILGDKENAFTLARDISSTLSSEKWMTTQSTAWSLIALTKFFGDSPPEETLSYSLSSNSKKQKYTSTSLVNSYPLDIENSKSIPVQIENHGSKALYVSIIWTGTPVNFNTEQEERGIRMSVIYRDKSNSIIDPGNLLQGMDFTAEVEIRNLSPFKIENIALSQIFPSGWEILNTRLFEGSAVENNSSYTYQDIRDDRVYTYFDLDTGKKKVYVLNLTAAYAGEYILPGVVCEGMYDHSIFVKTPGKAVKVSRD